MELVSELVVYQAYFNSFVSYKGRQNPGELLYKRAGRYAIFTYLMMKTLYSVICRERKK
jgi:hypothetical protein